MKKGRSHTSRPEPKKKKSQFIRWKNKYYKVAGGGNMYIEYLIFNIYIII